MSEKRKYDSTVARIAGNIASGMMGSRDYLKAAHELSGSDPAVTVARNAVEMARAIVAEVERTEPAKETT